MERGPVISHIALMLKYLDEGAIRAVYMVVKEFYDRIDDSPNKE